jgi:hypothetical protein
MEPWSSCDYRVITDWAITDWAITDWEITVWAITGWVRKTSGDRRFLLQLSRCAIARCDLTTDHPALFL